MNKHSSLFDHFALSSLVMKKSLITPTPGHDWEGVSEVVVAVAVGL